jgi:hypothetical protein
MAENPEIEKSIEAGEALCDQLGELVSKALKDAVDTIDTIILVDTAIKGLVVQHYCCMKSMGAENIHELIDQDFEIIHECVADWEPESEDPN